MLENDDRDDNKSNEQKSNFTRAAHFFCTFLCRCFAWLQRETSRNFLVTLNGGNGVCVLTSSLFFTAPHVHLAFACWLPAFLILSPPLQNFHVVLQKKKFLSVALDLCRSFSRWPAAYVLFFSVFVLLYIPNLWSKLNTLDNTDTETISTFRSRLYWNFSCLCITRREWLCDCPPKYPRVAFGLIELF